MVGNWRYANPTDSTNMRSRPSALANFPSMGETLAAPTQERPPVSRYGFHMQVAGTTDPTTANIKSLCSVEPSSDMTSAPLPLSSPMNSPTPRTPGQPTVPLSPPLSTLPQEARSLPESPSLPPSCPSTAGQGSPVFKEQTPSLGSNAVMFQVAVARTPTIQSATTLQPTEGIVELPTSETSNYAMYGSGGEAKSMHSQMGPRSTSQTSFTPTSSLKTPVKSHITPIVAEMTTPAQISARPVTMKSTVRLTTVENSTFHSRGAESGTLNTNSKKPQQTVQQPLVVPVAFMEDSDSEIAARLSALNLRPLQVISTIRRASSDTCLMRRTEAESKAMNLVSPLPRTPMLALSYRTGNKVEHDVKASFDFAQQIVDAVNDAAICLLIALGHRLELFAVLKRLAPAPRPASVIAAAANLHIRQVEEWLGAMTCAGIVEMRAEDNVTTGVTITSFVLPLEHALWLTWGYGTNLALLCESIPALGRVEHAIAKSYRRGGGVDRSAYIDYERVLAYDVMQTVGVRILSILRVIPELVDELSRGICVLCVGGAADAVYIRLARMFPRSWFTCYGTDARRTASARRSTEETGVTNVHFKTITRLDDIHERESYEAALVLEGSAVRESDYPIRCLISLRRALHYGRPLLYVEMMAAGDIQMDRTHSVATYLFSIAALYNVPKALAQGGQGSAASGIWGHVSVRNTLYDAGFTDVETSAIEDDSLNCVLVARSDNTGSEQSSSTSWVR